MPTIPKGYSKNPLPVGIDAIFTATVPTIVGSAIGATTNAVSRIAGVGVLRSGASEVAWVSRGVQVAAGAAASLIPSKVNLNVGDKLVALANEQVAGQMIQAVQNYGCWGVPLLFLLSNADASILVGITSTGVLYVSKDGGKTCKGVGVLGYAPRSAAFFNGAFRTYGTTATQGTVSTDGEVWTAQVVVSGPISPYTPNLFGGLLVKDGYLYGLNNTTGPLVRSADGINFAAYGVAFPQNINTGICGFGWTGSKWYVAGLVSTTTYIWTAPDGAAAWTAATGFSGTLGSLATVCNIGETVLAVNTSGQVYASLNGGSTFASTGTTLQSGGYPLLSTGQAVIGGADTNKECIWTPDRPVMGNAGFVKVAYGNNDGFADSSYGGLNTTPNCAFAIGGGKLWNQNYVSADLLLTRRGGFTINVGTLEVS